MKDKRLRHIVIYRLIPFLLLIITIIGLLVQFSIKSKENGKKNVEQNLIATTKIYAEQVGSELEKITASGYPVANFLSLYGEKDPEIIRQLAYSLQNNTKAYKVVLCDINGISVTHDLSNVKIDLTKLDYYKEIQNLDKQKYIYAADDGYTGEKAFISVIPMMQGEVLKGHILLYYKVSDLGKLIKIAEFDSHAYYAIMSKSGEVYGAEGETESELFSKEDFFGNILEQGDNENAVNKIKNNMMYQMSGVQYVTAEEESKALFYAPIGINRYYVVIGINESYIKMLENRSWSEVRKLLYEVFILLGVFSSISITMLVVTKIRSTAKNEELQNKAYTDLLTDLSNKIATEKQIKEYIAQHPNEQALMLMLDIDNFKRINDTQGHLFGDEVLRTLGYRMRAEFRVSDIVGRTGGDEFTIFLKNMRDESIIMKESRRVEKFFQTFQTGEYVKYSVTASIGASIYPQDGATFEELYKAADQALYLAKKRGKNQLAFYSDEKKEQ